MTNERAYQKLIDSIQGGKVITVEANPGIGLLTFSTQLAADVAKKQGLKIWLQTRNPFSTKALKNKFSEEEMTVTHIHPPLFFTGVKIIDFLIFGNCKPRLLIPSIKIIANRNNTPTICCIPLKRRWLRHQPCFFNFGLKKSVDIAILLHREGFTGKGDTDFSTDVTVIERGKKTYTFRIFLSSDSIDFPEGKAKKRSINIPHRHVK